MKHPFRSVMLMAGFAVALGSGSVMAAACNDEAAVATTRAAAEAACEAQGLGCTSAPNHGQYVRCIAQETNAAVTANALPRECKGAVKRCAARSTCGKPGFVTCCRSKTTATGTKTKCSTKSSEDRCTAPSGGTACVGNHASCCDACADGGCASPSGAFTN